MLDKSYFNVAERQSLDVPRIYEPEKICMNKNICRLKNGFIAHSLTYRCIEVALWNLPEKALSYSLG